MASLPFLRLAVMPSAMCLSSRNLIPTARSAILRTSSKSVHTLPARPRLLRASLLTPFASRAASSNALMSPAFDAASRSTYSREWWIRIGGTVGAVAGGTVLINWFLNRETREALAPYERQYLNSTFGYLGAGLGVLAASAYAMHRNGLSHRIMRANPWLVMGVSLVGSIGFMFGAMNTSPSNSVQKHLCWLGFNAFQAATLSPLLFLNPAILARAALYTTGMMGSLCWVGATAKSDAYLYMGGPLIAGLCVVALSSIAPLVLPATYLGTLAVTQSVSLYGGLAVFGGFTLYDTQKVLHHAKLAQRGAIPADPLRESISFELDFINIFVRMVTILQGGSSRRK